MKSIIAVIIAAGLLLGGCSKSDGPSGPSGQGEIRMSLIDAPAGYDAVNIVVTEVSVHKADSDTSSGWIVLNNNTHTYNLLSLTNGVTAILAQTTLDAGMYTQMRLKLGSGCTVVVNGVQAALDVSANSDLRLVHPFTVTSNGTAGLTLDFDAAHSIHAFGLAQFKLVPVIRTVDDDNAGSISGTVSPALARATVSTVAGSDTIRVATDSASGTFKLMAVPSGTYSVFVTPSNTFYADTTIASVKVQGGANTSLGTISLRAR